ncbi:MAG: hypothetical protein IJW41_04320 [Oscillospiraceae bacterium]|nr:hypothetical protein [Oscillospiraceae bacterium]
MNRKKLLIAIIAIVLVVAVLLVIYFDYRSKHSISLMSDEELLQYFEDNNIQLSKKLDTSTIRWMIKTLESDPDSDACTATNYEKVFNELRMVVKEHYGITP